MKLHHLALGARDVSALAAFYRDAFGLPESALHHHEDGTIRSIWLELGEAVLMIEACHDTRVVEGIGAGLFLLAFEVPAHERLEAEQRLLSLGGSIDERGRFTTFARDPEGNRVAISHYPLDAALAAKPPRVPR